MVRRNRISPYSVLQRLVVDGTRDGGGYRSIGRIHHFRLHDQRSGGAQRDTGPDGSATAARSAGGRQGVGLRAGRGPRVLPSPPRRQAAPLVLRRGAVTVKAMRYESSVTSLSWIPSEAVPSGARVAFDTGFTHYDDPPPTHIDDVEALQAAEKSRFANVLKAWIEVDGAGEITG